MATAVRLGHSGADRAPSGLLSVRAGSLLGEPGDPLAKPLGLEPEGLADVDEREPPSTVVGADPFCGAALGAGVGAIAGDAGKGAAAGAVVGGVAGRRRSMAAQQQQQEATRSAYDRAFAACMEGRGYTVR